MALAVEEKRTRLFLHREKWLEKESPQIRDNIWKAMGYVKMDYLPAKLGDR